LGTFAIAQLFLPTIKDKDEIARFYIPEIFREGLGFSGTTGRPRTLALKQKIFGKGN